jgi:hypothetical protein
MESPDHEEHVEHQASDSPPEGEQQTRHGGPAAVLPAIGTAEPLVRSGPAAISEQMNDPAGTMVIETNRIREPNAAFTPSFVMVPVEFDRPRHARSDTGDGGANGHESDENAKENQDKKGGKNGGPEEGNSKKKPDSHSRQDRNDDQGASHDHRSAAQGQSGHAPSLTRMLLFSGVVSLVCGLVGALGYSYFFGSGKSSDQKSSSKSSDSSKGSDSSGDSSSGSGSDSSKGSGSSGGSGSKPNSGPSSNTEASKFLQAEGAWLTAVKELKEAKEAEGVARRSEEETKSVLDFLKRTLFSAGRPGDVSLAQAFWAGGQGKDVTLRKALDVTESQVAEAFAEKPLAEASVREMLGLAFLNLGEPAQAVKEYERAFALRQAIQGVSDPEMAACRNQLAVVYRLAGRSAEGGRLFDLSPNSPARASALAINGSMLLLQKKPADAELKLRECLTIRQKMQPDDWTTFDTKSMLGEALLEQGKFAEAEPLLVSGYEGMKQRQDTIPAQEKPRLTRALERLVKLYEDWGKIDQATRWKQLESANAMKKS